jgi:hypothetical protein
VYQRQVHGDGDAKDSYGLLSEHSHPNSACFLPYCEYRGAEVRFISHLRICLSLARNAA